MAISTLLNHTLKKTYRKHGPAIKTKVVLEALKEREVVGPPQGHCQGTPWYLV